MPVALETTAKATWNAFRSVLTDVVQKNSLYPRVFPTLMDPSVLALFDGECLHFVLASDKTGAIATERWIDASSFGRQEGQKVVDAAIHGLGLNPYYYFEISLADVVNVDGSVPPAVQSVAIKYANTMLLKLMRPELSLPHVKLETYMDHFYQDHPVYDKNVFLAMKFGEGDQYRAIESTVRATLKLYGLNVLRADDKTYPKDNDLWDNVCVYMLGCAFGICVFDQISDREFNPNVPLEFGFMMALGKRVLLLKDQLMPKMPSDMTGKLYRPFDTYKIEQTVSRQLSLWAERDLGLKLV